MADVTLNAPALPNCEPEILDPEADASFDPRLSDRNIAFCHFFLANGGDATSAALSCGYPPARAQTFGLGLLERSEVSNYISALWRDEARASGITATTLIRQVRELAFGNIDDHIEKVVGDSGFVSIRLRNDVPRAKMAAVKSITVKETPGKFGVSRTVSVVLHDPMKPLMLLMTLLGIVPKPQPMDAGGQVNPTAEFEQYSIEELEAMAKKRGLPL